MQQFWTRPCALPAGDRIRISELIVKQLYRAKCIRDDLLALKERKRCHKSSDNVGVVGQNF